MSSTTDELVADLVGKELTMARDYAGIVNWSVSKIEKWTNSWTDFSITDPGILFINADAYLYDMINFRLDMAYMNNILRYTHSMESLHFMAGFVGLDIPSYQCSTATVRIFNKGTTDVDIPKDYPIYIRDRATGKEIWFYSLESGHITGTPGGSDFTSYKNFSFIEGKRVELNLRASSFDKYFRFIIATDQVGMNTVHVYGKLGGTNQWTEFTQVKDAFLTIADPPDEDSTEEEKQAFLSFSVHPAFNKTIIKLQPGIMAPGYLYPRDTAQVKIIYGIPSGIDGNVGKLNAITGGPLYAGGASTPANSKDEDLQNNLQVVIQMSEGAKEPLNLEDTRVYIGNNSWRVDTLTIKQDFDNLTEEGKVFEDFVRFTIKQKQGVEHMDCYALIGDELTEKLSKYIKGSPEKTAEEERICNIVYNYGKDLMFGFTDLSVYLFTERKITFNFKIILGTNSSNTSLIEARVKDIIREYLDRNTQPESMTIRRNELITRILERIKEVSAATCTNPTSDLRCTDTEIFVFDDTSQVCTFELKGW